MIHIYYGDGKGKTSSALGAGMRAKGAGMSVALVQFLKDNKSSELGVLPFEIFASPDSLPFNPDISYQKWVDSALDFIKSCDADMIILDEFLDVIPKFVSPLDAVSLVKSKDAEVIITGHKRVEELFEIASYITNMKSIKHPYDSGAKARKGIEF